MAEGQISQPLPARRMLALTAGAFVVASLIVFGAIVAYTAYGWLLKNASTTAVTTYAYVNPAVAVFLGWAIAGESIR